MENTLLSFYIPPYRNGKITHCTWDKLSWEYQGEYNGYIEFTIPDYTVRVWDEDSRPKGAKPFVWADLSCGHSEEPSLSPVTNCSPKVTSDLSTDWNNFIKNTCKVSYVKFRGTYTIQNVLNYYYKNPPTFIIPKLTSNNIKNLTNPNNWATYDNVAKISGSISIKKEVRNDKLVLGWYMRGSCHNCIRIHTYKIITFLQAFKFEYKGPLMET